MKRLHQLIISSFLGPFLITLLVLIVVFLIQYMMKYLSEIVGKGVEMEVYARLVGYYSINMIPRALPLAILLSSIITFGNLGEHKELTAMKGAGVSLLRLMYPLFIIACFLSVVLFVFHDRILPKVNLEAYSLMWDIKEKKPALDLKEGAFYNGIPGYSIRIGEKYPDGQSISDVMVYDHTKDIGNVNLTVADSGKMYTIKNQRYLVFDLYNGRNYQEVTDRKEAYKPKEFVRNIFDKSRMVFDLSSFAFKRTKKELFAQNKRMLNINELTHVIDSLSNKYRSDLQKVVDGIDNYYDYQFKKVLPEKSDADSVSEKQAAAASEQKNTRKDTANHGRDTLTQVDTISQKEFDPYTDSSLVPPSPELPEMTFSEHEKEQIYRKAVNQAQSISSYLKTRKKRIKRVNFDRIDYAIQREKKYANSASCIIMFLIGASLGAIIKRGGLGLPVLISLFFFVFYYAVSMIGENMADVARIPVPIGVWASNIVLAPFALILVWQARNDSSILDPDAYYVWFNRIKKKFPGK